MEICVKTKKALIVEDNEISAMILSNMLGLYQYENDIATTGEKAILLGMDYNYELIFMDYQMPDMTGYDILKAIRSSICKSKSSAIILLSANLNYDMRILFHNMNIVGIYEKPLHKQVLEDIINKVSNQSRNKESIQLPSDIIQNQKVLDDINRLKKEFEFVPELNFEQGLSNALNSPEKYLNMMELSAKQINEVIQKQNNDIVKNYDKSRIVHQLCNILLLVGATELSNEARVLENDLNSGSEKSINYDNFIYKVSRLSTLLSQIHENYTEYFRIKLYEEPFIPIGFEEYEHIFSQIIYYITMYEYDSIIKVMKELIICTPKECRDKLYHVLEQIENYEYENVLDELEQHKQDIIFAYGKLQN